MVSLNYLPPPQISFSPNPSATTDTQINIYNSIPSLTLNFYEGTLFDSANKSNSNKTKFNDTIITDTLASGIFSYVNDLLTPKRYITYSELINQNTSTGYYHFTTGYISFNNIQNLIIDESLNTFIIPSTYYRYLINTIYYRRWINLHKSIGIAFVMCFPPTILQDPTIDLNTRQITISFSKDIELNKSKVFIMSNNTSLKYRDCKLIDNKTLSIDFSNFNKYNDGTFTILIKHNAISSISNYYPQPLEKDYSFNFFIPEYKCPQPCLPPTIKTNLKGFPGGTLISTYNDYGSHNTTAMKYSKQVNNPTSYKNPSVIVKTSHKRVIPRISNF